MTTIPMAKMSPRIEDGVLHWYEGDTFEISMKFNIEDGGSAEAGESALMVFRDYKNSVIHEIEFTEFGTDNTVKFKMGESDTKKFPRGEYTYDIIYVSVYRRTVVNDNKIVVE